MLGGVGEIRIAYFFLIKTKIIQSRIFIHILPIGNTHQINQKTLVISDSIREKKTGSLKQIQFRPRSYVTYLSIEFFINHTTRFFVYNLNKLQQASSCFHHAACQQNIVLFGGIFAIKGLAPRISIDTFKYCSHFFNQS